MPCSFCREVGHVRTDCNHPNTIQIQMSIIENITNAYVSGTIYAFTRTEFNNTMHIFLDFKYTVNDLRKVHEYLKHRVRTITIEHQTPPDKKTLITFITSLSCVVFNYQFSGLENSPEHVPTPQGGTTGVRYVVNQLLHSPVGGLHPRATPPPPPSPTLATTHTAIRSPPRQDNTTNLPNYNGHVTPRLIIYTPNYGAAVDPSSQVVRLVRLTYTVKKTDKPVDEGSSSCAICFEILNNDTYVYFNCSHQFCKGCVKECIKRNNIKCSLCRAPITEIFTHKPVIHYSL